jgi:hypothetical protein
MELGESRMKRSLHIILLALIVGCSNPDSVMQTPIATKTEVLSTKTPVSGHTVLPVQITDTSTPFVTSTFGEEPNDAVIRNCLDVGNEKVSLSTILTVGTLAIYDNMEESSYLLELETKSRYPLPLKKTNKTFPPIMYVSPNGYYLAYVEDIQNESGDIIRQNIWVVDSKGTVLTDQPINPELLFSEWRWLDNDRLELNFRSVTPKDGTVVIFYPFKNKWEYLTNKLPNFYQYFDLKPPWWLIDYNSDLEWVVYLGQLEEVYTGVILWNVKSEEIIWQYADPNASIKVPKWSPSGTEVAVIVGGHLYLIKRNGDITITPDLGADSEIMGFVWSPDGNYIALLVRYNRPQLDGYLMFYDVQNKVIVDYCLQSDNLSGGYLPLWLENGQQIFFELISMKDDIPQQTPIIVDIKKENVYQLTKDIMPLAWMNSIP